MNILAFFKLVLSITMMTFRLGLDFENWHVQVPQVSIVPNDIN